MHGTATRQVFDLAPQQGYAPEIRYRGKLRTANRDNYGFIDRTTIGQVSHLREVARRFDEDLMIHIHQNPNLGGSLPDRQWVTFCVQPSDFARSGLEACDAELESVQPK